MYRSCIWENVAFLLLSAPFLDWIGARKHVGLLAFPCVHQPADEAPRRLLEFLALSLHRSSLFFFAIAMGTRLAVISALLCVAKSRNRPPPTLSVSGMRHSLTPLWTRRVVPQNVEAGLGSVKRRFVMHEAVLQHLARLLLPRPIRMLKSLAHLLESGCIDVASCVPLTQDL